MVAVYPSGAVVPRNLLRVYVELSAPVAEGWAQRSVGLHDGVTGERLEGAFLDMELWDRERRRVTLLLDPGRIKRGLASHGYPLEEGRDVVLRVGSTTERRYTVGSPVYARVDPGAWRIEPPLVRFDRPLDRALLERALTVDGRPGVAGPGELSWRGPGRGVLRVDALLEDLAGNSVRRVFDRDLDDPAHDPLDLDHVELSF